jgi:hypothetical protein
MNQYQEKRQARAERFRDLAAKFDSEGNRIYQNSKNMASVIPMGQPILVGHHSERRDRNYRNKIDNTFRKAFATFDKAKYYEDKARRAENANFISSDDPEALQLLKQKLQGLEALQIKMKEANKICTSKKITDEERHNKLSEMGFSKTAIFDLLNPKYSYQKKGFQTYALSNNNQNIANVKKRIEALEVKATLQNQEHFVNNIKILDNVEDNRLQIFFNSKPSEEVRKDLKKCGFRWSPSNNCWQSYRHQHNLISAKRICENV